MGSLPQRTVGVTSASRSSFVPYKTQISMRFFLLALAACACAALPMGTTTGDARRSGRTRVVKNFIKYTNMADLFVDQSTAITMIANDAKLSQMLGSCLENPQKKNCGKGMQKLVDQLNMVKGFKCTKCTKEQEKHLMDNVNLLVELLAKNQRNPLLLKFAQLFGN